MNGWPGVWRLSGTRWWWQIPTSLPCTPRVVGVRRRTSATLGHWRKPANSARISRPHRTSDARRHLRAQLAVREALVRTRARYISLMRALVRREGFRVGSGGAEAFPTRMEVLELPEHLKAEVEPLLSLMEPLNEQIAALNATLEQVAQQDEAVANLCPTCPAWTRATSPQRSPRGPCPTVPAWTRATSPSAHHEPRVRRCPPRRSPRGPRPPNSVRRAEPSHQRTPGGFQPSNTHCLDRPSLAAA